MRSRVGAQQISHKGRDSRYRLLGGATFLVPLAVIFCLSNLVGQVYPQITPDPPSPYQGVTI